MGIFNLKNHLEIQASFLSIQDSAQRDAFIGFRGDFKNMSLYAEGEMVGEATKKF